MNLYRLDLDGKIWKHHVIAILVATKLKTEIPQLRRFFFLKLKFQGRTQPQLGNRGPELDGSVQLEEKSLQFAPRCETFALHK